MNPIVCVCGRYLFLAQVGHSGVLLQCQHCDHEIVYTIAVSEYGEELVQEGDD